MRHAIPAIIVAALACVPASDLHAQSVEADVLKTVRQLFDGMRKGDSSMVRAAFHADAALLTTLVRDGKTMVRKEAIEDFAKAVGTPHTEVWDERIWNERVLIDGPLASVWTDYAFFLGPKFSHCGVDAFMLAKLPDGWKIIALADTRRQEPCKQGP
jgi:putative lumazine-binding protein